MFNTRKAALLMLVLGVLAIIVGRAFTQSEHINLHTLDGKEINLNELKGKVVVLSFGGTWVPLTSRELPALQKIADRFSNRGVQIYWVALNSARPGARNYASDANLEEFAQKNNLRIKLLRDPDQEAYRYFGLDALPALVILDREGKVARKHIGFGTDQGEANNQLVREL
ncbi:MAG: TlpA family protein disulfide reductase, partial [Blastocatellia bacterium]|nr:TlpA family protein disulfide reductase [Blastocatellia bacterium]